MRERLYEILEGDTKASATYGRVMTVLIFLSLVPLCFHEEMMLLLALEYACVAVFIADYAARWMTADKNHVFSGGASTGAVKWSITKAANPLKLAKATRTVKVAEVKKKNKVVAGAKVSMRGQGRVTYKKSKVNKKAANFTVNKKTGKITVKKGTPKGTYKVTVKAVASGNANYENSAGKTAVVTVKVK